MAGDAINDKDFPVTEHYEEIRQYLSQYSSRVLEALNDAWQEYMERYPERFSPEAWCDECSLQIKDFSEGSLVCTEDGEFYIYHNSCVTEDITNRESLQKLIEEQDPEGFKSFAIQCGVDSRVIEETLNRLRLNGWYKINKNSSIIYFIQSGSNGPIKIGYSANSLKRRLAALQTAHPEALYVLGFVEGDRSLERILHQRFQSYRKEGEWFEPHSDILAFVKENTVK